MSATIVKRRFAMLLITALAIQWSSLCYPRTAAAPPQDDEETEARYPGESKPDISVRPDLAGHLSADRPLALEDLNLLLELSQYLIDKSNTTMRGRAAQDLGTLGHEYGIPALLAVFRDESERGDLPNKCLLSLSRIRDKRVVEILINEGLGNEPRFDGNAIAGLANLVGYPPELHHISDFGSIKHPPKDPEQREAYLEIWRSWWEENRDTIKLKRGHGW